MTAPIARDDWPRLLALVDQALQQPEHGRDAWLRSLDLPAPLADALQGLLDERRAIESDDFLQDLPALPAGHLRPTTGSLAPGTLIGPWRLLRELGQGGMSVVWLAERADGQVARQVGLKLPHAGPGNDLLARRLLRERRILAALEHPHIARLYDVGLSEAGTPYLVMEHVPGVHLLAHADAQRLGLRQRVALFQQVLAAVQHAHGQLVLHRDLKPGNILVGPGDTVKLLDFGIAKLMAGDGTAPDLTELTRAGDHQFTPSHASPEQLRSQPLGTASDVYALGVVLCELLCGQRPFAEQATTAAQLEAAILGEDPRPPSRCTLAADAAQARALPTAAALARALRGDLDAIVLKTLARAPADRYPSAEAFSADLARWQQAQPVRARAPGRLYHLGKFISRHRLGVALGSAAAAAVLAAVGIALAQSHTARQEAARATTARDYLLQLFQDAAPDRNRGADLGATQLLERGRLKAHTELASQQRLQAELLAGIGEAQYDMDEPVGARLALGQAAALFHQLGDPRQEARTRLALLRLLMDEDALPTTLLEQRQALAALEPTMLGDRLLRLTWLCRQGRLASFIDQMASTMALSAQCLREADRSAPEQAALAFEAALDLSLQRLDAGDADGAESSWREAETLADAASTIPRPVRRWQLANVEAMRQTLQGRSADLIRRLPVVTAECEAGLGAGSAKCADLRLWLVRALNHAGDVEAALVHLPALERWASRSRSVWARNIATREMARTLALAARTRQQPGPSQTLEALVQPGAGEPLPGPDQLANLKTLAEIRLLAGDFAGHAAWLSRAEALLPQADGERRRTRLHIGLARGLGLQAKGQDTDALAAMGSLCANTDTQVHGVLMQLNCVRSLAATGRKSEAVALVARGVPILSKTLGPDAPNTQRARQLLQALQAPGGWKPPPWTPAQIFYAF